ncbi:MAG TPA: phosphotransferase, partial [Albitalea sp.]
ALDAARHALWRAPGRTFRMPEPLGAGRAADGGAGEHVRWERFVEGERLEAAAARHGWAPVLRAAVAAVADLHRRTLPGLALQDEAAVLARLEGKVLRRIRTALPGCVPECERLVAALQARLPRDPAPRATLHGDLHTGNLLCTDDGRVAFIDLDNLVLGSPAYDLALLASRLMLLGLLDPAAAPPRELAVEALPRWYVEAGGDPRVLDEYRWHLALLLVSRQVKTCIRHHAPGLASLGRALFALAHAVLDEAP